MVVAGAYSPRINFQRRLIGQVLEDQRTVEVLRNALSHAQWPGKNTSVSL